MNKREQESEETTLAQLSSLVETRSLSSQKKRSLCCYLSPENKPSDRKLLLTKAASVREVTSFARVARRADYPLLGVSLSITVNDSREQRKNSASESAQRKKGGSMKTGPMLTAVVMSVGFLTIASAAPPSPEGPSSSTVEALVNKYVDADFIHEELPPPEQCGRYADKLMFAYDWRVVVHTSGPYDPVHQVWPVAAMIIVRCGPFQPQSQPPGETQDSAFPLRAETPIDFQLSIDPEHEQQWKVQEVTLWKSKQRVIEQ
jgi:hypothetical protein